MQKIKCTLTVFFEPPFWVGILEREMGGQLSVCKITFGAEPKDYEVYALLQAHWHTLKFGGSSEATDLGVKTKNPKRLQRQIGKQLNRRGASTKAQEALRLQLEQRKTTRKKNASIQKKKRKQAHYALKRTQRKEKRKH